MEVKCNIQILNTAKFYLTNCYERCINVYSKENGHHSEEDE